MTVGVQHIRPCQSIERGRDHQFQVALGEDDIGILPIEHFALLRDADLPFKRADRLGVDGTMRGATASSHCAATSMEETQLYATFASHFMQGTVGAGDLP